MITPADLEQAERYLEPLRYVTETGVTVTAYQARDPDHPSSPFWVAYKTYTPPDMPVLTGPLVLFLHDVHQSGQLYHEAASALAERGMAASALSLGLHGSGRWYSHDSWRPEELTVERYCRHVRLVIQALPAGCSLVLAGGGVLGSLLAQLIALDYPLAGIVLLGGCLPQLAVFTWKEHPRQWWLLRPKPARTALVPPLDQARIRERWLGYRDVADEDVFAVWQLLCAESPLVYTAYETLASQPPPLPPVPALVMAGEQDALVPPAHLVETATAYGVHPAIMPGAPHLLARCHQLPAVIDRLESFCRDVVSRTHAMPLQEE